MTHVERARWILNAKVKSTVRKKDYGLGIPGITIPADHTVSNFTTWVGTEAPDVPLHFDSSSSRAWTPLAERWRGPREVAEVASPKLG
jgi:hypothetical protein